MAQEHHRLKPGLLDAVEAAAGAPNHSFSEKTSNSQITHLDHRTGNICCLNVLALGGKEEQTDILYVCGGMYGGREGGRGQYGNHLLLAVYKLFC